MLNKTQIKQIIKRMRGLDRTRRSLQALSSEILAASKRAIFAYHRDDQKAAQQELAIAQQKLKMGWRFVKQEPRITYDGSWRAAQEEFAEAHLLSQFIKTGKVGHVPEVADDPEILLGGLSDLTGELVRRSVRVAGQRDGAAVEKMFYAVDEVVGFLLQMDLTGHLRTKVDQAKQNLRKLEEIRYDLAIRSPSRSHD
ncbi:MAG: hypothetical protein Q8R07_04510 [Candidatus Uhrbacteria bacterium]|nr:hypothetical protein [Candidatus Uhrbacteria bacterium]